MLTSRTLRQGLPAPDAVAVDEGAVVALEVLDLVAPVRADAQLGVVVGHEQVGKHDVVVLGPPDAHSARDLVDAAQLADAHLAGGAAGQRRGPAASAGAGLRAEPGALWHQRGRLAPATGPPGVSGGPGREQARAGAKHLPPGVPSVIDDRPGEHQARDPVAVDVGAAAAVVLEHPAHLGIETDRCVLPRRPVVRDDDVGGARRARC